MIKKIYRLRQEEVKKVLKYAKPFFSYHVTCYALKNMLSLNRFAIIISGKSIPNAVHRNFFRRKFYTLVSENILPKKQHGYDLVFLVKKQIKLDKTDNSSMLSFEKDITFLKQKIISNPSHER